ncbi:hypothetical protein JW887_01335 [Candidatus Dojkabacteria bacterium]|nr:hypothetical protein [Candidatus Dojkabacteria bacterium]
MNKDNAVNNAENVDIKGPNDKEPIVQRDVYYTWHAPSRHFKKMDMKRFWLIVAVVLGTFVILAILGQYWLMAAIASVLFLVYAVGTVPPVDIEHRITSLGIESANAEFLWKDMKTYFYSQKDRQLILNVDTNLRFTPRLIMLVDKKQLDETNEILFTKLKYADLSKQNYLSKMIDGQWINMLGEGKESKV